MAITKTETSNATLWRAAEDTQMLPGRTGSYRQILEEGQFPNIVGFVCVAHPVNHDLNERGEANSRLMAAAPALLAALRGMLDAFHEDPFEADQSGAAEKAYEALARAEGEQL